MRFLSGLLLVCSLVFGNSVLAQQDTGDFNIRIFGDIDAVAPTTPALTSATAIATDQIDLAWTTATDNFAVSGYVVFRDGSAISTTTQTTYSDTGLTASTSYSYFVRAFDPSFNYSSSSNVLSATTPDNPPPVTPDEEGSNQSTAARVVLNELRITSGISTSSFFIATARPARFEVRWGRTTSYELGYTVNDRFVSVYETTLTDLEPGTTYEYQVVGYTPLGAEFVLERGQFSTLESKSVLPPPNVTRFMAMQSGEDVRLSWGTPLSTPYEYIRIVRSYLGFPTHPGDGAVVYQGRNEAVVDKGILTQFSPVYYTAFVVDESGNVSSGAVAIAYAKATTPPGGGTESGVVPVGTPTPPQGVEEPAVASTSPALPVGTRMPAVSEIVLTQDERRLSFADQSITLSADDTFVLSIAKDAVFENIKTIIVTITDPTDSRNTYSFLLKLNKDKSAYEAVIAPLGVEGVSRVTVDIYDYKSSVVGTYTKSVAFVAHDSQEVMPIFPDLLIKKGIPVLLLFAFPALFVLLFILYRRRHHSS